MPGKLVYFPLGARADPIRALCCLANHEYENEKISQEEFGTLKPTLPMGSLPIW